MMCNENWKGAINMGKRKHIYNEVKWVEPISEQNLFSSLDIERVGTCSDDSDEPICE